MIRDFVRKIGDKIELGECSIEPSDYYFVHIITFHKKFNDNTLKLFYPDKNKYRDYKRYEKDFGDSFFIKIAIWSNFLHTDLGDLRVPDLNDDEKIYLLDKIASCLPSFQNKRTLDVPPPHLGAS